MEALGLFQTFGRHHRLLLEHLPASIVIGLIAGAAFNNASVFLWAIVFGYLIDADHLIDYLLHTVKNKKRIRVRDFLSGAYFHKSGRIIIILHSYELVLILISAGLIYSGTIAVGFFTGAAALAMPLIHDQLTNKPSLAGYFLLARIWSGFSLEWFCRNPSRAEN